MQPQQQQQTVFAQPAVVQPTYISQPYTMASVVNSYRHRQSTVIGILLIVLGGVSIVFNVVDLAVGTDWHRWNSYAYTYNYYDYDSTTESLSETSNGDSGHGIWCGAMVSIQFQRQLRGYLQQN